MIISPLESYKDKCTVYCQFMPVIIVLFYGRSYWLYKQPVLGPTDLTGTMHPRYKHSIFLLSSAWIRVFMLLYIHVYVSGKCILYIYMKIHVHTVHTCSVFNMYFALCQRELYNFFFVFYQ